MNSRSCLARLRRSACIAIFAPIFLLACAGEYPEKTDKGTEPATDGMVEAATNNEASVQGDTSAAECSATGAAAVCDPVGGSTGCASGACYVVKDVGTACVCDPGTVGVGGACNTTIECAPGHVCAGTQAPGSCLPTCWSNDPICDAGEVCTAIQGFSDFGYCEPQT